MNRITSQFPDTLKQVREQLKQSAWLSGTVAIICSFVFPILEGFIIKDILTGKFNDPLLVTSFLFIPIIHLVLFVINFKASIPIPQIILEMDKQQKEIENYRIQVEVQEIILEGFRMSIKTTELSLITILSNSDDFTLGELFLKVIEPWQKNRSNVFDFQDGKAFYNMAVYLEEKNLLRLKARLCDDRIVRRDREWQVGEGHVGSCFVQKKLIVMDDISSLPLADASKTYTSDKDYYRSFMGYPLRYIDSVVGIVVVTSSEPEQFDAIVHGERIALLAKSLEFCIYLHRRETYAN